MKKSALTFLANFVLATPMILMGCSAGSNVNQLFVNKDECEKDVHCLMDEAQRQYDSGDFEQAKKFGEKAHDIDANNEEVGILMGYIHLSLAGMDAIQLAQRLNDQNTESSSSESKDANSSLQTLAVAIGMPESDFTALTLDNNASGDIKGDSSVSAFADYKVLLPKTAAEARKASTHSTGNLQKAIEYICPFVEDAAKQTDANGDPRHSETYCTKSSNTFHNGAKSHFLWALAHLTEAIAFYNVALYAPDGTTPNLIKRADALQTAKLSILDYVTAVTELASVVDLVLPTTGAAANESMLNFIFTDLVTTQLAFATIAGIPASITSTLTKSIDDLKAQRDKIGNTSSGASASSQAMKDQMTKGLANTLRVQITEKSQAGEFTEAQKTDACAAYKKVSSTAFDVCP